MNWDAVGAIGELVGAAAVVATLVYLAVQIRQNTKSMEETRKVELSRNYMQMTELRSNMVLHVSGSKELSEIYVKIGEQGLDSLTKVEHHRIFRREQVNLHVNGSSFYQYEMGLIDKRQFEESKGVFKGNRDFWQSLGLNVQYHMDWIERLEEKDDS